MLQVFINRKYRKETYTIGQIYVNGKMLCNSMEDADRHIFQGQPLADILKIKAKGQTAIPTGTYRLRVTDSPKFKRPLIEVCDVPGFTGIRIHALNTAEQSEGCIGPGMNTAVGRITDSRKYEDILAKMVQADKDAYLTIV